MSPILFFYAANQAAVQPCIHPGLAGNALLCLCRWTCTQKQPPSVAVFHAAPVVSLALGSGFSVALHCLERFSSDVTHGHTHTHTDGVVNNCLCSAKQKEGAATSLQSEATLCLQVRESPRRDDKRHNSRLQLERNVSCVRLSGRLSKIRPSVSPASL